MYSINKYGAIALGAVLTFSSGHGFGDIEGQVNPELQRVKPTYTCSQSENKFGTVTRYLKKLRGLQNGILKKREYSTSCALVAVHGEKEKCELGSQFHQTSQHQYQQLVTKNFYDDIVVRVRCKSNDPMITGIADNWVYGTEPLPKMITFEDKILRAKVLERPHYLDPSLSYIGARIEEKVVLGRGELPIQFNATYYHSGVDTSGQERSRELTWEFIVYPVDAFGELMPILNPMPRRDEMKNGVNYTERVNDTSGKIYPPSWISLKLIPQPSDKACELAIPAESLKFGLDSEIFDPSES